MKEVQVDANGLVDETINEPLDSPEVMRKVNIHVLKTQATFSSCFQLLRRFYILMTSESIEIDEECSVCMEKMRVQESSG